MSTCRAGLSEWSPFGEELGFHLRGGHFGIAGETLQKIDDALGAGRPGQHRIDCYIRAPGQFS